MDDKSDLILILLNPITNDKVALTPAAKMGHVKHVLNDYCALHKYKMFTNMEQRVRTRGKNETPYTFSLDELAI